MRRTYSAVFVLLSFTHGTSVAQQRIKRDTLVEPRGLSENASTGSKETDLAGVGAGLVAPQPTPRPPLSPAAARADRAAARHPQIERARQLVRQWSALFTRLGKKAPDEASGAPMQREKLVQQARAQAAREYGQYYRLVRALAASYHADTAADPLLGSGSFGTDLRPPADPCGRIRWMAAVVGGPATAKVPATPPTAGQPVRPDRGMPAGRSPAEAPVCQSEARALSATSLRLQGIFGSLLHWSEFHSRWLAPAIGPQSAAAAPGASMAEQPAPVDDDGATLDLKALTIPKDSQDQPPRKPGRGKEQIPARVRYLGHKP